LLKKLRGLNRRLIESVIHKRRKQRFEQDDFPKRFACSKEISYICRDRFG
jgi:predicted nucleic acid-binding OB-fold protein